jgi:GNAT superfamily N-acetyltransferase
MIVIIRPVQQADAPALRRLAQALATSFVVEEQAFAETFAQLVAMEHLYLRAAELDHTLVGYLLGLEHPTFYANGCVGWVEEVFVVAEKRSQGIGRRLMDDFEMWCRSRRCALIAVATRRAAEFYRALGYEESAIYFRKIL